MTLIVLILDFFDVVWLPWWVYLIGFIVEAK